MKSKEILPIETRDRLLGNYYSHNEVEEFVPTILDALEITESEIEEKDNELKQKEELLQCFKRVHLEDLELIESKDKEIAELKERLRRESYDLQFHQKKQLEIDVLQKAQRSEIQSLKEEVEIQKKKNVLKMLPHFMDEKYKQYQLIIRDLKEEVERYKRLVPENCINSYSKGSFCPNKNTCLKCLSK